MPAEKWIIEPANAFKQKISLPPDKYDDFNTLNQLSLVTIIRQLSQLSLISNKLFEELLTDCSNLSKRTIKLHKKIKQLNELTTKFNAKKVKIPISSIEKCRSIKDHFAIEQIIDQKLFTDTNRPYCLVKRLEFINKLDQEERIKPVITIDLNEPIYTGLPIKLIKKRKLDLLDIETQQPNNIINIKLPRDDIVRRAQTPLCKSMVQLHSRPLDDDIYNLTESDNLDHLMLSSNHPLQKIKENQDKRRNSLRTSRSTGLIHQRSTNFKEQIKNQILNNQLNSTIKTKNLESNHYCCTNISTGLTEMNNDYTNDFQNRFNNNQYNNQATSQLDFDISTMTIIKKCSSCSTNENSISNLTCSCASSNEPIYMLPSLKEQTEALSKEYPSNVVAINTDQIQFTRMSSFRKSLIHSDFNIKRKKLKLGNKENSKLKRRNTICESICHQRNCNLNHCSKKKCCTTTNTLNIKDCDQNKLNKLDKQTDRRRSTGSINLIDSCCQTDLTLGINTQSINRLNNQSTESTSRKQVIKYNNYTNINSDKVKVKAEIHNFKQESMYAKINKKSNEDERSSSGNWSAASSTCATSCSTATTTKSSIHNDDSNRINRESQQNKDIAKRNSYSACSLSSQKFNDQQETGCLKNNSEINVINSDIRLNDQNKNEFIKFRQQPQNIKYANRDSKESWLQFFESNESTDTITNETNLDNNNKIKNSKKDIQSNDVNHQKKFKPNRKRNELDSITNLEEHEDELLSIHSEDTDGYYTSMHTDSGLFRERAQELPPLNSTFISNDLNENNEKDDKKLDKQNQSTKQQITIKKDDNLMNGTLKKKLTAPSPPPRSSSVMSNSSTLNNIQQLTSLMSNQTTYDDNSSVCSDATLSGHTNTSSQQYNCKSTTTTNLIQQNSSKTNEIITNIPSQVQERQNISRANDFQTNVTPSLKSPSPANTWCSSMNSDLDLVKLRNKTTIDVTGYPSMVAYPTDSELSSLSSFGNLAFALSGNHRCTVISKSHNDSNYSNSINQFKNNASQEPQFSKRDSTSSLDSKLSKRSLSTIGSYASLTKLKLLLKPLRNSLMKSGGKSDEKKTKENKIKQSKDDCLIDEEKSNKRKGFFTRFGSINRGKIVKSNHLEKLQKNTLENERDQDDMVKLRNTINKWRIEPISQETQINKVLNKNTTKETNVKQQFSEEDENEYYAKLSQQSSNILRNSVDYSLNNDLKRFSISSNNSQITTKDNNNECYLLSKQRLLQQQTLGDLNVNKLSSSLNQPLTRPLNQSSLNKEKRNSDAALFTKLFPISRYSKVQPEDHQFIVPSLPTPSYYENVANTRFSYSSDNGCSNSLALSNNSSHYSTFSNRPKTLNLSASLSIPFNQQQQQQIYGQTVLSNSYNCTFNNSMNRPFLNNYKLINEPQLINGQSLESSNLSSFNSQLPLIQNSNIPNVNLLNNNNNNFNYLNQPIYHQAVLYHPQQQQQQTINYQQNLNNHHHLHNHFQQTSSISSHQSTSSNASYNYLSSNSSSNANTPSSISSSSPLHQQTSQLNQIKKANNNNNQFKNLPATTLQSTNTAIVSPFCTNNNTQQSTDSLKKSEEKLKDLKDNNKIIKRSTDDSLLTKIESRTLNDNNIDQIQFRDSMRLTRQQREQTLARIQRSSWTPSSSMVSSPSDSLGSSSNSSTDQSATINDINKLINELSNFDNAENDNKKLNGELSDQLNGKNDPIYGINIALTRLPIMQTTSNENSIKDLNILKQSNGTNINDFKKLLSTKTKTEINGLNKKSASEQLKIIRKPLSALTALEAVNEKLNENNCLNNYEKETYDNVTDEENENQNKEINDNFKQTSNNSSLISLMNGQSYHHNNNIANSYSPNLRTRVINGRVYKTPYRLETMYPPINEELPEINEENNEDGEFITSNQQNTSTWV